MKPCTKCGMVKHDTLRRGLCASCYRLNRMRNLAYARWAPDLVPIDLTLLHIARLNAAGMENPQIRRLADIPVPTFNCLLKGRDGKPQLRVSRSTARRIKSVPIPANRAELLATATGREIVAAVGAQRRLRALVASSWPMVKLAAELRMRPDAFHHLIHHSERIYASRHHQVAALFDRLQFEQGPSESARRYGAARKWSLPFQWDEESIDEPDGHPVPGARRRERAAS